MKKSTILACLLGTIVSINLVAKAHARAVISIKVEDVGSTVLAAGADPETCNGGQGEPDPVTGIRPGDTDTSGCEYDPTLDGYAGQFKFGKLKPITPAGGTTFWTGDVDDGTIDFAMANPTGSFSTGFTFFDLPFVPFTSGASDMNLAGDLTLTINSFPFGGNFNSGTDFFLPPDAPSIMINWVIPTADPNKFLVSFQFEHLITPEEDASFANINARWMVEGTMTVEAVASDPTSNDGAVVPVVGLNVLTDESALISAGIVQDEGMETVCDPDCMDFMAPASAGVMTVVVPLSAAIPADSVYRVYINGSWMDFDTSTGDSLASAPGTQGACPLPGDAAYNSPVTAGDFCLQLTIADGGSNDGDVNADLVTHLGGYARPVPETPADEVPADDGKAPATDTGSTSLWFAFTMLGLLGLARRRYG